MFRLEYTVLLVVDIQEKLFNVMHDKEALADSNSRLIQGMKALDIPVIVTEQNPAGLGRTIPQLAELLPGVKPLEKMAFSCAKETNITDMLTKLKKESRFQILITGIEAHICIYQTAMDLRQGNIQVVTDCISSRTRENKNAAIRRMETEGIRMTNTEMILFELLGTASHEKFREISALIK
jgi:isochorismate hydrolase